VFNASDLANGNLLSTKKKKQKEEPQPEQKLESVVEKVEKTKPSDVEVQSRISVYPNPVTTGLVKLSLQDLQPGRYQLQLLDISGKLLRTQSVRVNTKTQIEEFRLPRLIAGGNYLMRVVNDQKKVMNVEQLVVQ
jgi:hypothetical protein